jgi:hypothetical protein
VTISVIAPRYRWWTQTLVDLSKISNNATCAPPSLLKANTIRVARWRGLVMPLLDLRVSGVVIPDPVCSS